MSDGVRVSYRSTRKFEFLFCLGSGLFGIAAIYLFTQNGDRTGCFQWDLIFVLVHREHDHVNDSTTNLTSVGFEKVLGLSTGVEKYEKGILTCSCFANRRS